MHFQYQCSVHACQLPLIFYLSQVKKTAARRLFFMQLKKPYPHFFVLAGVFCFGLAYLVPNHYPPWTGFHHEAVAFFALFMLLIGVMLGSDSVELPLSVCAFCLFSIVPWIQLEFGLLSYSGDALLAALYLFAFAASVVIGFTFARQAGEGGYFFRYLMISVALAATLSSVLAIAQWQLQEDFFGAAIVNVRLGERAAGNVAQSNHLATLLLMGLVACWFLYRTRVLSVVSLILASVVFSIGMLAAESRTLIISILVLNIFFVFSRRYEKNWKISIFTISIWSTFFFAASFFWGRLNELIFLANAKALRLNSTGRIDTWRQLWQGIESQPWQGFGWRQTAAAMAAGAERRPSVSIYEGMSDFGHNFFLDVLAWFGLPLGVVISIVLVLWLGRIVAALKSQRSFFAIAMIAPLGVHSLLEYPYSYAHFFLPAGVFIGFALSEGNSLTLKNGSRLLGCSFVLMATVCALTIFDYVRAEEDYRIARYESLNVGVVPIGFVPKNLLILDQLEALIMAARFKPVVGLTSGEIEGFSLSLRRFPSVFGQTSLVIALALNGSMEEAKLTFSKIEARFGEESWIRANQRIRREAVEYPVLNQLFASSH